MAWPIAVARKAPTMPSTVVRMNPLGLFGPGDSSRAMIPARKPTMTIQRMPLMIAVLFLKKQGLKYLKLIGFSRISLLKAPRYFVFGRQPSVRRQMVDHVGQMLAEAREQFVARQAALRHQTVD